MIAWTISLVAAAVVGFVVGVQLGQPEPALHKCEECGALFPLHDDGCAS